MWVSWEQHRRSRELAAATETELREFTSSLPRILKHPFLLIRTFVAVMVRRPRTLFVQNPSVMLGYWCCLLKKIFRYQLIVDSHNEGVVPFNYQSRTYVATTKAIQRMADLTIVTNDVLKKVVEDNGGRGFVLPDKVPQMSLDDDKVESEENSVVFICTYAPDEPYVEVIEAARALGESVKLYISGNYKKADAAIVEGAPENVTFTGFLDDNDYLKLLQSAAVIVDLTMMDDCLVCGAYEAVALGKPLVTSDTTALRSYFNKGVVYTKNDRESLAVSIREALDRSDDLRLEIQKLGEELEISWNQRFSGLLGLIDGK